MIRIFILALGLLHLHHKPATTPVSPVITAQDETQVTAFELAVLGKLGDLQDTYPNVPKRFFDAVENDVVKVIPEHVTDATFRKDFDQLGDDYESLRFIIQQYEDSDAI